MYHYDTVVRNLVPFWLEMHSFHFCHICLLFFIYAYFTPFYYLIYSRYVSRFEF